MTATWEMGEEPVVTVDPRAVPGDPVALAADDELMPLRQRAAARKAEFESNGQAIGQWADAEGFLRSDVYRVLNGLTPCKRGASHRIAVRLGIKEGEIA